MSRKPKSNIYEMQYLDLATDIVLIRGLSTKPLYAIFDNMGNRTYCKNILSGLQNHAALVEATFVCNKSEAIAYRITKLHGFELIDITKPKYGYSSNISLYQNISKIT